jgi:hypothetical protein
VEFERLVQIQQNVNPRTKPSPSREAARLVMVERFSLVEAVRRVSEMPEFIRYNQKHNRKGLTVQAVANAIRKYSKMYLKLAPIVQIQNQQQ